ncbi:conserved phage C-terminal domain-containing protein [Clostridium gasigenes]|uniref:Phage conserved hypothetical protein C-terminal domain-containing protein n=1 Tax=Clostridium gasigenes TaxID=94869 RepID=A0A1H0MEW6_9CLOT|nr:conserved phage C-terminal domain-containing protein [Clostridium gasigenes]SDO78944.1 phage conserved hypothetical protein, C-terminal domain-containing protein [Clostridium gasigenes]
MKASASKGIWIPEELWQNEDLTVMEKLFVVKINALDGEDGCYASNNYFSEYFKLSKSRCSVIIKSLKDKGYIVIKYFYEEGKKLIERRVIKIKKAVSKLFKEVKDKRLNMHVENESAKVSEAVGELEDGYFENIKSKKEKMDVYKNIMDYLNMKCKTNYKYTNEETQNLINARIKEGNTLEDFIKVIDNKYKQWEDSDMRRYLRPVTLFSEKFERYLNEEIIEKKSFVSVLKNKSGQVYDNNFKHKESYKDYEEEGWEGDEPF